MTRRASAALPSPAPLPSRPPRAPREPTATSQSHPRGPGSTLRARTSPKSGAAAKEAATKEAPAKEATAEKPASDTAEKPATDKLPTEPTKISDGTKPA
jgi:hypothetical protein